MKPFYQSDDVTIYHGRAEAALPGPEPGSIDLVLTDPPYAVSKPGEDIVVTGHAPYRRDFGEWDREFSPAFLLEQSARLLRPGGSFVAFCSDDLVANYHSTPLKHRKLGVWAKTNPPCRVRPGYQHGGELWVYQTKPGAAPTWNGGACQSNIITTANARSTEGPLLHPNQKPLALISGFIARHSNPGDLVLDPYMGSGTTAVACRNLGRRFVGVEQSEQFCAVAVERLAQRTLELEQRREPEQVSMFQEAV